MVEEVRAVAKIAHKILQIYMYVTFPFKSFISWNTEIPYTMGKGHH